MASVVYSEPEQNTVLTLSPMEALSVRQALRSYAKTARTTVAVCLYDILEEMTKD